MSEKKVQLATELDATGFKAGAQQVEAAAAGMSRKVGDEAEKAGKGIGGIGEQSENAARKLERDTKSMIASVQRATAEFQAGGRNTAAYFEAIAQQRGVNAETLRPYIDGLRKAEEATAVARRGLDGMKLTAGETAAALRSVPAQFTDIFTSLASGQSPLTVLLQQGGQLKDQFGGAGAAAQALGGYVAGLINPFSIAAAVLGTLAVGFVKGRSEASGYAEALILSGNAAGATADQLADMAQALDGVSGTQAKAADVLTRIAATGEVGAAGLQRYAQAAIELERAGGPAAEKTADAFAELGRKPLEAVLKLNEAQRFLTAETFAQIKALADVGRETEAARLAQEAYAAAIEERTPRLEERLGLVERAWRRIKDEAKEAGDAILSVGRQDTLGQRIAALEQLRDRLLDPGGGYGNGSDAATGVELQRLDAQIAALREQERLQGRVALIARERSQQEEAGIKWAKEQVNYAGVEAKLERDIARVRAEGAAARAPEIEIEQRIAVLRERANRGGRSGEGEAQRQASLLSQLSGLTSTYTQDLARLDAMRTKGLISEERYGELLRALVFAQPVVKQGQEAIAKAIEAEAKATAQAIAERERYVQGLDRQLEAGDRALEQLQDELIGMTAGKEVLRQRIALRMQEQAAALELQAIRLEDRDLDSAEAQRLRERARQIREEIALRRGIATAADDADVETANRRAADKMASEFQRAADQAGQSLADAIMQGGQNAGELLRNYFRTLVLRPIVEAVVRPFASVVTGVLGAAGPASAAAGSAGSFMGNAAAGVGLGSLGGLGGIFSSGAMLAVNGGGGLALQGAGAMIQGGSVAQGLAQGAGVGAAYLGGAAIGVYGGRAISGGYSVGGGSGNTAVNVGTAIGMAIAGPIGAALGGLAGGLVNRAFGRKLEDSGFEGTFSAEGFTGQQFEFFKGGLFRSDKTKTGPLDQALGEVLTAGAKAATAQVRQYAEVLGLPVEAMEGYTRAMRLSLRGLNEQQATEAIARSVAEFQEGLAERFAGQIASLKRSGETFVDTLTRLTGLEMFSKSINELGGVFRQVARLGFDARESIVAMAGGLDAFTARATNFVQQYYGRDEIAGIKARDVQTQLLELGIGQAVNTRSDFRRVVEGVDVSTEAGQRLLVQLLDLAGPFADVATYLEETGLTLLDAARQAPAAGILPSAFEAQGREQVDAINNVASRTGDVVERMDQLLLLVRDGASRYFIPRAPEAGLAL